MRVFSTYTADTQRNGPEPEFDCRMQEASWLIILTWSWHRIRPILLRSVIILIDRLSKIN